MWPEISRTLFAIRDDEGLKKQYFFTQAAPETTPRETLDKKKEFARLYSRAATHARGALVDLEQSEAEALTEQIASKNALKAFENTQAADDVQRKIEEYKALVAKIERGTFENGVQKVMGIKDMKIQLELQKAHLKDKESYVKDQKRLVEMVNQQIEAKKMWREQHHPSPPLNALGGGVDYSGLWEQAQYSHLENVRLLPGHTPKSFVGLIRTLEEEVAMLKASFDKAKRRLDRRQADLTEANAFLEPLKAERDVLEKSVRNTDRNVAAFGNIGRYLLTAYPQDRTWGGEGLSPAAARERWAALVRVFHAPRRGFVRGREGMGELPAFLTTKFAPGTTFADAVAKEVFDVAVVPYPSLTEAYQILGARWCSDPAFARELIRLCIDVAGLPAKVIRSKFDDSANVRKSWVVYEPDPTALKLPATQEAEAKFETDVYNVTAIRPRIQAFAVAVEVAVRKVRFLLGKRKIANKPMNMELEPPRGFEMYGAQASNIIGWGLPLDTVQTSHNTDDGVLYLLRVRSALYSMMGHMGTERTVAGQRGGLGDAWARATAKLLSEGGHSRQLAIAIDGDSGAMREDEADARDRPGGYGIAGQKQTSEFFEFDVKTKGPESERALAQLLEYDDPDPEACMFNHLHPTVIHLTGPTASVALLTAFLRSPHSVALVLYYSRYHVLYKDDRTWRFAKSDGKVAEDAAPQGNVVLIDPKDQTTTQRQAFENAVQAAASAASALEPGSEWVPITFYDGFRDTGEDSKDGFLVAMARAMVLALGVHRTVEGEQPLYPLLGEQDYTTFNDRYKPGTKYRRRRDQASAASDLKGGFGPLCMALAALSHNEHTVAAGSKNVQTSRVELWD